MSSLLLNALKRIEARRDEVALELPHGAPAADEAAPIFAEAAAPAPVIPLEPPAGVWLVDEGDQAFTSHRVSLPAFELLDSIQLALADGPELRWSIETPLEFPGEVVYEADEAPVEDSPELPLSEAEDSADEDSPELAASEAEEAEVEVSPELPATVVGEADPAATVEEEIACEGQAEAEPSEVSPVAEESIRPVVMASELDGTQVERRARPPEQIRTLPPDPAPSPLRLNETLAQQPRSRMRQDASLRSLASQVREFREEILVRLPTGIPQALMFVSPGYAAAHVPVLAALATSLADCGHGEVLAVDAAAAMLGLAAEFDAPRQPGLYDVLAERLSWEGACHPTGYHHLSVMPRGTLTSHVEDIPAQQLVRLINSLKDRFHYILFDAASLDGQLEQGLAATCDAAILITALEETDRREAAGVLQRLRKGPARVIGSLVIS